MVPQDIVITDGTDRFINGRQFPAGNIIDPAAHDASDMVVIFRDAIESLLRASHFEFLNKPRF